MLKVRSIVATKRSSWISKQLQEVTTKIGSGATPLGGEAAYKLAGTSLIRSLNVHDGAFKWKNLAFIDDEQSAQLSNVVVEENDVLLNITGASVARCCIVPADVLPARVNQHVAIIRPRADILLPQFLQHMLVAAEYKDRLLGVGESAGSTRQALTKAQLQHFPVDFPASLEEQHRIVALLDEAFEGIATAKASAKKNLRNARELFESRCDAVLARTVDGYVNTTLGSELELLSGYAFPSGGYTNEANSTRLLRGDNIMQGYLRWDDAKTWPVEKCNAYSRFALDAGDVVLAMDRPWVKAGLKRAQVSAEDLPCLLVQRTARLRPKKRLNKEFLFHLIGSRSFSQHLLEVQTGLGVPHISAKQIENFRFMLPRIEDQQVIASELQSLLQNTQMLTELCERKLAALEELKKSLLQLAFSGAL